MPTSRASARTANASARAGEQRDDEPEAEPLVGRELVARAGTGARRTPTASTALRATALQPTVERAPKQAQGAPARPRRIAATIVAAKVAISAAAR